MFEVEYLCFGWFKKDGVKANLGQYDWPNGGYFIDFAFSPLKCCTIFYVK